MCWLHAKTVELGKEYLVNLMDLFSDFNINELCCGFLLEWPCGLSIENQQHVGFEELVKNNCRRHQIHQLNHASGCSRDRDLLKT